MRWEKHATQIFPCCKLSNPRFSSILIWVHNSQPFVRHRHLGLHPGERGILQVCFIAQEGMDIKIGSIFTSSWHLSPIRAGNLQTKSTSTANSPDQQPWKGEVGFFHHQEISGNVSSRIHAHLQSFTWGNRSIPLREFASNWKIPRLFPIAF